MSYNVFSQDFIDVFSFSLGDMGFGFNNSADNEIKNFEFNLSAANFFIEYPPPFLDDSKARIGIKMSPFNLRVLKDNNSFSFVNIDIYTDFLSGHSKPYNNLGPFASINWLLFENKHFDSAFYIFSAGLRFTSFIVRPEKSPFRIQLINFDIGYRRINNTNNIYLAVKLDFIDYIMFPIFTWAILRGGSV
ncbi:MAG: hypothetical protein LBC76_02380 [Treponema sp.]|nr:hypothetical protein [Treponema sp.]